jgi:putative flippase GtrA
MARYFVSGGVAFVVDATLLYFLTEWVGLFYLVSTVLSYAVGLIITYLFSIKWVFDHRSVDNRKVEFGVFVVIGVAGLGLTSLCMWFFTAVVGVHYLVSKVVTTIIVFVWNFIAKKLLLFRRKKNGK